jgi:hypothetical protein
MLVRYYVWDHETRTMRRLKNGWEIAGALILCGALATVIIYISELSGCVKDQEEINPVVVIMIVTIYLFTLIWSRPD